jgi:hypothetical protein
MARAWREHGARGEAVSAYIEHGELDAAYRDGLLQRQVALQAEGRRVLDTLGLEALLSRAGTVKVHGSFVTGLMVWRDLDLGVTAPGLMSEDAFATMLPLLTHPQVARVRYQNEVGALNPTGDPREERYFFVTYYRTEAGDEWKIDVSFWVSPLPRVERLSPERIASQLTEETRLVILWLKDIWHRRAVYMRDMSSPDIYDAVFDYGVRTPAQFEAYLAERGIRS